MQRRTHARLAPFHRVPLLPPCIPSSACCMLLWTCCSVYLHALDELFCRRYCLPFMPAATMHAGFAFSHRCSGSAAVPGYSHALLLYITSAAPCMVLSSPLFPHTTSLFTYIIYHSYGSTRWQQRCGFCCCLPALCVLHAVPHRVRVCRLCAPRTAGCTAACAQRLTVRRAISLALATSLRLLPLRLPSCCLLGASLFCTRCLGQNIITYHYAVRWDVLLPAGFSLPWHAYLHAHRTVAAAVACYLRFTIAANINICLCLLRCMLQRPPAVWVLYTTPLPHLHGLPCMPLPSAPLSRLLHFSLRSPCLLLCLRAYLLTLAAYPLRVYSASASLATLTCCMAALVSTFRLYAVTVWQRDNAASVCAVLPGLTPLYAVHCCTCYCGFSPAANACSACAFAIPSPQRALTRTAARAEFCATPTWHHIHCGLRFAMVHVRLLAPVPGFAALPATRTAALPRLPACAMPPLSIAPVLSRCMQHFTAYCSRWHCLTATAPATNASTFSIRVPFPGFCLHLPAVRVACSFSTLVAARFLLDYTCWLPYAAGSHPALTFPLPSHVRGIQYCYRTHHAIFVLAFLAIHFPSPPLLALLRVIHHLTPHMPLQFAAACFCLFLSAFASRCLVFWRGTAATAVFRGLSEPP